MEVILSGPIGHSVVKNVLVECRTEPEHVIAQDQSTVEIFALDIPMRPDFVICLHVLVGIAYI